MIIVLVARVVQKPDVPLVPLQPRRLVPVNIDVMVALRPHLLDREVCVSLLIPVEEAPIVRGECVGYHDAAHRSWWYLVKLL